MSQSEPSAVPSTAPALHLVEIQSSGVVDRPIAQLWALVADFSNLSRWHPDVVESQIESGSGTSEGAVRALVLRNGMRLRERLVAISDAEHFYTYSVIESPMPVRDHQSTVRFESRGLNATEVTWSARFNVVGADPAAIAEGVKAGVIDLGIQGLRQALAGDNAT
jgi:carbon monoxide dehydrogenase subunit G